MSDLAPVLIFETDIESSGAFDNALTRAGIKHVSHLVSLRRGHAPPPDEHFQAILTRHNPLILITSWEIIGPIVRAVSLKMRNQKPEEKWIISNYSMQTLEMHGAISWADEIYQKSISPSELVYEIEQHLQRISPESLALPTIY